MEKIMNRISDIEENAIQILDRVSEEKKLRYEKMNKEIETFDSEITSHTQDKLNSLQSKLDTEVASEHKKLLATNEKQLKDLEINFNNNRHALIDKVFHNIIGE